MAEQRQQQTDADLQLKDTSTAAEKGTNGDQAEPIDATDPGGSWYPQSGEEANKADGAE